MDQVGTHRGPSEDNFGFSQQRGPSVRRFQTATRLALQWAFAPEGHPFGPNEKGRPQPVPNRQIQIRGGWVIFPEKQGLAC